MVFLSLFLTSFLAGSFVPLGSEAHLLYLLSKGGHFWEIIFVAGLGNTFGGMTCYYIAKVGGRPLIKKYLKYSDEKISLWESRLKNKSEMAAILCWLPVIGEIIAAAIGLISNRAGLIFLFMFLGKFARYLAISGIGQSFF